MHLLVLLAAAHTVTTANAATAVTAGTEESAEAAGYVDRAHAAARRFLAAVCDPVLSAEKPC